MTSKSTNLSLDSATLSWDALAQQLETFIEAWEGGKPPMLGDFLPEETSLRQMTLVELVKIDLEYRAKRPDDFKPVEDYAAEFGELATAGQVPCDLIYEEYHVRRQAGHDVSPDEFFKRFPDQAEELKRLMGIDSPTVSTALSGMVGLATELEPGEQIDDFQLMLRLGKGAFATVFLARQNSMQRIVALKVSADRGNEPQTLAQLDHPYIVRVYDQRQLPQQRVRLLYMQYVSGGTLQGVIDRVRHLPPRDRNGQILFDAIDAELERSGQLAAGDAPLRQILAGMSWPKVVGRLGFQLAKALKHAHDKGVLHRDIKPANVLLAADGSPKLADFNISFSSKVEGSTAAAYFGGSLAYMSPEQLEACNPLHEREAGQLDARADIYSLGVLLWELLYGQRPFRDEKLAGGWSQTLEEMTKRRRAGPPDEVDPAEQVPGEPELRRVLLKCLSPDPIDRFADGDELARQLRLCQEARTQQILQMPKQGWREWRHLVRIAPITAMFIAGVTPNSISAVFNLIHNYFEVIQRLRDAGVDAAFDRVVYIVNGIVFPVGVFTIVWLAWGVRRRIRQADDPPAADEDMPRLRVRALRLGHYTALVSIMLWIVSGIVFPTSIHILMGDITVFGGALGLYGLFGTSMLVCGSIVLAYAFYFVTYLSVRVFYPTLLRHSTPGPQDEQALLQLRRLSNWYLWCAVAVPVLAGLVFALTDFFGLGSSAAWAPLVVGVAGVLGMFLTIWMNSIIQRDITALLRAAAPAESFGLTTDSLDTFY